MQTHTGKVGTQMREVVRSKVFSLVSGRLVNSTEVSTVQTECSESGNQTFYLLSSICHQSKIESDFSQIHQVDYRVRIHTGFPMWIGLEQNGRERLIYVTDFASSFLWPPSLCRLS
jgi:hypothetical protein